jgi:rubrerythrin
MAEVYKAGWTMEDVPWSRLDASKIEPWLVVAIKAASLVEANAPDYVVYLKRVFKNSGPETHAAIEQWGREESRHGEALARWAELADPSFSFAETFARFRKGYKPEHFFGDGEGSVRGTRRGEMIARCVVESGTSTFYTAIKEATDEPVLKEIAGRIAADEFRHYKLFYETQQAQDEPALPFWRRLKVAIGRVTESDDDELAYAYYCARVPADKERYVPYRRREMSSATFATLTHIYRRHHLQRLAQMVAKAVDLDPQGRIAKFAGALLWRMFRMRAGLSGAAA